MGQEKEIRKDVNVKVKMDVDLTDIRVFGDMNDPDVDVEEIAYWIQQYIADGGDFEFAYEIMDTQKEANDESETTEKPDVYLVIYENRDNTQFNAEVFNDKESAWNSIVEEVEEYLGIDVSNAEDNYIVEDIEEYYDMDVSNAEDANSAVISPYNFVYIPSASISFKMQREPINNG